MVGSKFPSSYGIQDELKGDFDLEENQRASQGIAEAVEFTPRVRSNPWRIEFYEEKKAKIVRGNKHKRAANSCLCAG